VELPVSRSLGPHEVEDCLRRCQDAVRRAEGPSVVLAYCSAAVWARHLVRTLAGRVDVPLVSVFGTTVTEREWTEEFTALARRFDPQADLSGLSPDRRPSPRPVRSSTAAAPPTAFWRGCASSWSRR
jgi:hypothetical protein